MRYAKVRQIVYMPKFYRFYRNIELFVSYIAIIHKFIYIFVN